MPPKTKAHETNGHAGTPRPQKTGKPSSVSVKAGQRVGLVNRINQLAKQQESALGTDPDLVDSILADIKSLGVIGEENISLLMYLTGTSRKLQHPLRMIIRGDSSAGKSFVQTKVTSLFPPEDVVLATSLTPQALYYGKPGWLEHKFLVKGERSHRTDEEGADSTAALRQLISEDRIAKHVTINMETVTIEQNGPIAFCETTTAASIFAEDLNRCVPVWADDSPEQTRRILQAAANAYSDPADATPEEIVTRHHKFQRSLKPAAVVIPFASKLADFLPAEKLEARRIFKQLLATIETIAFLHQYQRQRDSNGRLIATGADYQLARRLLLPSLHDAIGIGAKLQKSYAGLKKEFPKDTFTTTDALQKKVFGNKMTATTMLNKLVALGAVKCIAKSSGPKPAQWQLTGDSIRPVLPLTVKA